MSERIPLGSTPEGRAFVRRLRDEATELALFFTGQPREKMMAALEQTRCNLEAEFAQILGAEMAAVIATAFVRAVVDQRRELEALGPRGADQSN
jgi:hypothetical protein